MKGKLLLLTNNRDVAGMTKLRHLLIIFLICLGLFVLPTSSNSNEVGETMRDILGPPPSPIKERIIFWEPLPDRTLLVDYGNVKYRYNILVVERPMGCAEVTYNKDGTYTFMTHIGDHAVSYLVSAYPEFVRFDKDEGWIWLEKIK